MHIRILLLATVLSSLAAAPAVATVVPHPVRVRLLGEPSVAERGRPLRITLELGVKRPAVVENLRIEGNGWSGRLVTAARPGVALVGARVRELCARPFPPGRHELEWDGDNDAGRPVPPGIYFIIRHAVDGTGGQQRVVRLN